MRTPGKHITRRSFIAAAAAAPAAVPAVVRGRPAPSDRLTMAMIGLGSMGLRHVKGFLEEKDCRIVAVCDVDNTRRRQAAAVIEKHENGGSCDRVNDFTELLTRDGLDTLCIAIPDHWHAVVSILACRAGKDIYGEKPLARTIREGRAMVEAVRRNGIIWQTGSWQRSTAHFRFACELVRNGRIGTLREVLVGIGPGKPIEPQPVMPVPDGFDYDRWLGPAPRAPYTEKRCHWNFRWIRDYSGGQVTDWGAHHIDIAHWGMGVDGSGPLTVAGKGIFPDTGLWDAAVDYDFTCTYAGGIRMRVASNNHVRQGVRFIGDDGWVRATRSKTTAEPAALLRETFGAGEIHLPRPSGGHRQGHRRDFLDCVRTRSEPITPIEVGHGSIIPAHLGNIAMLLGRKIRWDPRREEIVGDTAAAAMTGRALREPWGLL